MNECQLRERERERERERNYLFGLKSTNNSCTIIPRYKNNAKGYKHTEIVEPSIRRQPGEGVKKEKDISLYSPSNFGRVDRNLHFERKKVEIIGSNSPSKIAPSPRVRITEGHRPEPKVREHLLGLALKSSSISSVGNAI